MGGPQMPMPMPGMPMPQMAGPPVLAEVPTEQLVRGVRLDEETETRLKAYLSEEIGRSLRYFKDRNKRIKRDRKMYSEKRDIKTFPWRGASNISAPIARPQTDQLTGRVRGAFESVDPLVTPVPVDQASASADDLHSVGQYMNSELAQPGMDYKSKTDEFIFETGLVGACFSKVAWTKNTRIVTRFGREPVVDENGQPVLEITPDGMVAQRTRTVIRDEEETEYEGNSIDNIQAEQMYVPPEFDCCDALDKANWVAQRYVAVISELEPDAGSEKDIENGEAIYREDVLERLKGKDDLTARGDGTYWSDLPDNRNQFEAPTDEDAAQLELYEWWGWFRVEKKKPLRHVCVIWSQQHQEILSVRYNFFFHGKHPFSRAAFAEDGSFVPDGIPARLKHVQTLANNITNGAVDAATLALKPVIFTDLTSMNRGLHDFWYPGKVVPVTDPTKVVPTQFGDVSQGALHMLTVADRYAQQVVGVTDGMSGVMEGQMQQESSMSAAGRMGNIHPLVRQFVTNVRTAKERELELMFWNCYQFRPRGGQYMQQQPDGSYAQKAFAMPPNAGGKYRFRIKVTSMATSPELRRQLVQQVAALAAAETQAITQIVDALHNPGNTKIKTDLLMKAGSLKSEMLRQAIREFGLPGLDAEIPNWKEMWEQNGQEVEQRKQSQAQQKPPIDDTILRAFLSHWSLFSAETRADVLSRIAGGIDPGSELTNEVRAAQARNAPPPQPGMGAPQPGGMPGPPGFPPG